MNHLNFYQFYSDGILELSFSNGETRFIKLTKDSGRVVTRKKVGTISNINHPGIYVGVDEQTNQPFILHNHYKIFKTAGVSNFDEYRAGQVVHWDNRPCSNSKMQVLQIGLDHAINREPYHWLNYNCQITVNDACNNQRTSEDVGKWVGRIATGILGLIIIDIATS